MKTKAEKKSGKTRENRPFFSQNGFFSVQTKLNVGQPGDKYEQEADRVAESVVNRQAETPTFFPPAQPLNIQSKPIAETITPLIQKAEEEEVQTKLEIQRQEELEVAQPKLKIQRQEEEEEMQMQPIKEEEELLQPKMESLTVGNSSTTEQKLKSSRGNGSRLNTETRAQMEQGFGADFSGVKIHTDNMAVQMNENLGAQAFTSGNDIYFNEGKYNPNSQNGKKLLAHELTHTVQQGGMVAQNMVQKWPWSLTLEQQKAIFMGRTYGPLTITRGGPGAGFEAGYNPRSRRLNITVRGKIRFADGLSRSGASFTSPNRSMRNAGMIPILNRLPANVQARVLPYFQFSEAEKQVHMERFTRNLRVVEGIYQNTGMSFRVAEAGWEDITASPRINIDITEGEAVHQVDRRSFLGVSFNITNSRTSDHIQVEIVKQPSMGEYREISRLIAEHDATINVTPGMVRGVRSSQGNDSGARGAAPEGFNNLMSLRSNAVDALGDLNYSHSVFFENNSAELSGEANAGLNAFFSDPMILWDRYDRGINISLNGYASSPGTTSYNTELVERRISAVETAITTRAASSNATPIIAGNVVIFNDADQSAEADRAANPTVHDPSLFRRVDIVIERNDRRRQNTLAHEMGHVFGLGDEYVGGTRGVGDAARHGPWAQSAGVAEGANVANDNRLMSGGNEFRAAYYSNFAYALDQLTSKHWIIVT